MKNANFPLSISVVIPAYNVEAYVALAVDSVLGQTRAADEIIVVDDGSTDGTGRILQAYGAAVTYLRQENAGGGAARNRGIEAARGEWIAFLDADDEWLPEALERQCAIHAAHPGLQWSYANMLVRPVGEPEAYPSHDITAAGRLLSADGPFFEDCLAAYAAGMPTNMITLMVRKAVLLEVGMFDPHRPWAQDADLAFRIAYRYPAVGYEAQPLAINNFARPGSISTVNRLGIARQKELIETHLKLSAEAGRQAAFAPAAARLIGRWMNAARHAGLSRQAACAYREFAPLLPADLAREIRWRSRTGALMNALFDGYWAVKRRMRKTIRKPK